MYMTCGMVVSLVLVFRSENISLVCFFNALRAFVFQMWILRWTRKLTLILTSFEYKSKLSLNCHLQFELCFSYQVFILLSTAWPWISLTWINLRCLWPYVIQYLLPLQVNQLHINIGEICHLNLLQMLTLLSPTHSSPFLVRTIVFDLFICTFCTSVFILTLNCLE